MTFDSRSLLHMVVVLAVSIGLGLLVYLSNPDGIWLYTPPADGSGSSASAFGLGACVGAIIGVFCYTLALIYQLVKKSRSAIVISPSVSAIAFGIFLAFFFGFFFECFEETFGDDFVKLLN